MDSLCDSMFHCMILIWFSGSAGGSIAARSRVSSGGSDLSCWRQKASISAGVITSAGNVTASSALSGFRIFGAEVKLPILTEKSAMRLESGRERCSVSSCERREQ